ncbi:UDP-N-acetylmuramoyl-tripeptide--D-alanyl-D-alanine ligase [Bifidobacterium oedipodis]|uniref:UDP-N-acetylmuramoyl-tripeptide--D-alanyl-D-alanine ligase n=1 Tax=Bifidobacterium oedipodis TaxID=2675322 RepID=A0A7Y0EMF4_9BIFI|nr:UDP-N-acetylmuramoyl-tripeptide--D-alanyl-D-alanine ligase [Bifidobacterium sp. DSM 109957]NMM92949.1 UDP-N-acetylmuramoyl-tripeptide--D-alanyl-D-alan ine ligase [Bifidobacterium sp. DSM 109957]
MVPMSVAEVAQAVGGRLIGGDGLGKPATSALSDSRQVCEGSVFVAIKGERVDGHDFVAGLADRGAVAAIVDHEVPDAGLPQVVVENTVAALGQLAKHNIARRRAMDGDFDIIGLTGSVGKTTTKDLLAALLGTLGSTVAPVGSFNNEIGLPLTALKVNEATRFFVAEMGANHLGEIAGLTRIAPPDTAVVLKVGVAHLGEFGSRERIAQAKSEIVTGLVPTGTAVLNADDEHIVPMAALAPADVLWFGLEGTSETGEQAANANKVYADHIDADSADHARFTLHTPDGAAVPVHLGIPGRHNTMNALAAATVAWHYGMKTEAIAAGLSAQRTISPHRMAISTVERDSACFTLIDDSFNANPDSMKAGLDGLKAWRPADNGTPWRIAVLGGMLELGGDESELHRQVGAYAASLDLDAIIAVGSAADQHLDELAQALAEGAEGTGGSERTAGSGTQGSGSCDTLVSWVHGTDQADALVTRLAKEHGDCVVLLKGSHASGLSALAQCWTTKN